MGKRKNDRLEEMFQDIDSRFHVFSEEKIKTGIEDVEKKALEENNAKIKEIKEKIAIKQELINALQGKNGAENSPRIQAAIKSAEAELKEAQEQLKNQEARASKLDKEKFYMQTYAKNRSQINQIRAFKESIAKKLPAEIAKRDESKTKMETAEESLKEVNKKLADEKLTMQMEQDEYNNLLGQKAQLEKVVKEQTEIYKKAKERIIELQTKIGKCDLAWKTLFTGKSWDDIQRRALDPNTKFIRRVDEERLSIKDKKNLPDEKTKKDITKTFDEVKAEQGERGPEGEKPELPVPAPKHPRWEKFKGFFKKAGQKLKEIFVGEDDLQKPDDSKMDNIPADKRDQFLEELRKHVDKEYGKQLKEEKEANYIEQHKAKQKTTEAQEKDAR